MGNLVDELEREVAHSDLMRGMAQYWMQRAQDAQRTLAIVVYAAGGKVVVHSGDLHDAPELELVRFNQLNDMTTHFIARKKGTTPGTEG